MESLIRRTCPDDWRGVSVISVAPLPIVRSLRHFVGGQHWREVEIYGNPS